MAFQIVQRKRFCREVEPGVARIFSSGTASLVVKDLQRAGVVGDKAAVLADPETRRVAVREPAAGEPAFTVRGKPGSHTATISIKGAMEAAGVDVEGAGRRTYPVTHEGGMLVIDLSSAPRKRAEPKR